MQHNFIKIKLSKLSLLGALSAGIIISLIAKEMCKKEKVEKSDRDNEDVLVIDMDDGRAEVVLADRGRSSRKGGTSVVSRYSKSR